MNASTITLYNGVEIPRLGIGTAAMDKSKFRNVINTALDCIFPEQNTMITTFESSACHVNYFKYNGNSFLLKYIFFTLP